MAKFIFFIAVFAVFYVYFGYPLIVFLLSKMRPVSVNKKSYEPCVSIVIAAYNEESSIAETVSNKLELDYPADKYEIIVISDGSEDRTDEIVAAFSDQRVRLIRQEPRAGKTSALNRAVLESRGEIVLFSDANSIYATDALRKLVANFADKTVGYVTGKMIYANPDGTSIGDGCTAYMKYENALRNFESSFNSVVGVDGGIDAVRKELYRAMRPDQLPDFVLPLDVVKQGFRVVYEPEAILKEQSLKNQSDEYRMRVRVSLRAFWALFDMRELLFSRSNPVFAWQLWSHKVLRYLCFIFLFLALVSNMLIMGSGVLWSMLFGFQIFAYGIALLAPLFETKGLSSKLIVFLRYFTLLNLASAHAFFKFLCGQKQVLWTPRTG